MIYAFDPGKMTGWARLSPGGEFQSGQLEWYDSLYFVHETLKSGGRPDIVCEDFIITSETVKKSRQSYSSEGIGVLRFLTKSYGCRFEIQTPAAAKSFSSNDKLKRIGWYVPGQDHANDAARHLLLYAVKQGRIRLDQFIERDPT